MGKPRQYGLAFYAALCFKPKIFQTRRTKRRPRLEEFRNARLFFSNGRLGADFSEQEIFRRYIHIASFLSVFIGRCTCCLTFWNQMDHDLVRCFPHGRSFNRIRRLQQVLGLDFKVRGVGVNNSFAFGRLFYRKRQRNCVELVPGFAVDGAFFKYAASNVFSNANGSTIFLYLFLPLHLRSFALGSAFENNLAKRFLEDILNLQRWQRKLKQF